MKGPGESCRSGLVMAEAGCVKARTGQENATSPEAHRVHGRRWLLMVEEVSVEVMDAKNLGPASK